MQPNNTPKVNVAVKPPVHKRTRHILETPQTPATPLPSNGFDLTGWANQVLGIAPATTTSTTATATTNVVQPTNEQQH